MQSGRKCKWKSVVKQIAKSVVCFVLCIALVFGYSYKPAQAMGMEAVFAGAVAGATGVTLSAVAGAAVVAAGLSALGIGVSALVHGESYGDACGRIWNNMTTKAKTDLMILGMGTAPIVHFGSDAIQELNDSVSSALTQRATYDSVVSDGIPTGAMSIASGGRSVEIMKKVFPGVPEMEFNRTGELFDALSITDFKIIGKISPGQNLYFPMKDGKCLKLAAQSAVIASGGYMEVYLYNNSTDAENERNWVRGSSIGLGFIDKACTHHRIQNKELFTSAIVVAYTLDGVSKIGMMVTTKMIHTEKDEICVPARAHWIDVKTDRISVADSPKAIDDGPINVANDQFYAREISAPVKSPH